MVKIAAGVLGFWLGVIGLTWLVFAAPLIAGIIVFVVGSVAATMAIQSLVEVR